MEERGLAFAGALARPPGGVPLTPTRIWLSRRPNASVERRIIGIDALAFLFTLGGAVLNLSRRCLLAPREGSLFTL